MVVQYSDNVLMYFFKIVAVFSIYGVFSVTLFFFFGAFLMFLYIHRKLYSSQLHDDEVIFQEYVRDTLDDDQDHDSLAALHNRYFAILRSLFYFYFFLWFLTYFGVTKALYLYLLFSLLVYVYLYARRDFRGYERSYLNRISSLDPRPGFFVPNDFSGDVDDGFAFRFLEDFETKPFLDTRFQVLQSPSSLNSYGNVNAFNVTFSKDPHFLSKILYYYADIYIYNSIHNFWVAVSNAGLDVADRQVFKSPESYVDNVHMRFYPTEHFGPAGIPARAAPTASYIKSQAFLFNTIRDVYRSIAVRSFSDSLYLRYLHDPFFRLGVAVPGNRSCFPRYKEHSGFPKFRLLLESFLLSPARSEFLLQNVKKEFGEDEDLLRNIVSSFNLKVKGSLFGMFPSSYYFRWLSYFLSFFLTETSLNFRFKNILVPEHWYSMASLYRHKRKPSRTAAGLYLSRLGTDQMRYNTGHTRKRGILEVVFNSCMYPINNRSRTYYYKNGFTTFSVLDSFDFVSLVLEPFFMYPAKAYLNHVRSRKEGSDGLGLRKPLRVFEIRDVIRKSGDGMEPFLSTDYFMRISSVSFVNDLGSAGYNDVSEPQIAYDDSLSIFSSLTNSSVMTAFRNFDFKSERLSNMLLSVDPGWVALRDVVKSNPTFKIYLKNLIYNKHSSEFYEWFGSRNSSKPLFYLYELSLDLFVKSPDLLKIVAGDGVRPLDSPNADLPVVFGNYRKLFNRAALKFSSGCGKLFEGNFEPIRFRLNKVRRSEVSRVLPTSLPLYKKSYTHFGQLRFMRLGTLSPFSTLNLLNLESLAGRVKRSRLRILLRDPFLFFSRARRPSRNRLFRRFLWSNIFLKSAIAAASRAAVSPPEDLSKHLSAFLLKNLFPWLRDRYGFSHAYINYLFSDLTIFRRYAFFSYKENSFLKSVNLWSGMPKDQFDISLWKSYLSSIFSDNRFYEYSISKRHSSAFALSSLLSDSEASMNLLFKVKNNYVLQFPTKYMNFMAVHGSGGSMSFGRGVWKLLVATLNALVYLLIRSVLGVDRPDSGKSFDNFFILLEQLKWDLKPYGYIAKHLFLTLDPLFGLKDVPNIVPDDSVVGSVLHSAGRVRTVNWWEGIPSSTVFKAVEHVLQSRVDKDLTTIDRCSFGRYMAGSWDDFSKRGFVVNLKKLSSAGLPHDFVLSIFSAGATRASIVVAIIGSQLSDNLKRIAYSIFLNEFRYRVNRYSTPLREYSDNAWGLDSFYGLKDLSNFIFSAGTADGPNVQSYLGDSRLFYAEAPPSVLSAFQTPVTLHPRLGTFAHAELLTLDSLNNTLRSNWYYSLFMRKPYFHHERLSSVDIAKGGDHLYLSNPSVNIKFSRISFLYFALYWFAKQVGLFFRITARYSIKHYYIDYVSDPLSTRT